MISDEQLRSLLLELAKRLEVIDNPLGILPEVNRDLAIRARAAATELEKREKITDEEIYQFWENNPQLGFCDKPVGLVRAAFAHFGGGEVKPEQ